MIGKRSHMLEVVEILPDSRVRCRCDCGKERISRVGHFNAGNVKSCGCTRFPKEVPGAHGPCIIDGCPNDRCNSKGWCWQHYTRLRRHGDPLTLGIGHGPKWLKDHKDHDGDECLIWPFGSRSNGYGSVVWDGHASVASRVMCELRHGPPPTPDHEAAHSCGHGDLGCVNPKHLRWATPVENQSDKIIHGTQPRGETHWRATITADQVIAIRACETVAEAYRLAPNLTPRYIRGLRSRRSWKHI